MGTCWSAVGQREKCLEPCQGHHSVYVHPEGSYNNTTYNVVYRPPHLNERLAPGEARPRFWVNPYNAPHSSAVVSVAWCHSCHPQHANMPRLSNTKRSKSKKQQQQKDHQVELPYHAGDDQSLEGGLGLDTQHQQGSNDPMMCGDNSLMVKAYPAFLTPFVNKVVRIRLVYTDPKVGRLVGEYSHLKHGRETETDPMMETSHLVRSMHSIKLHLQYSSVVPGLPEVTVEENHGGVKRLKKVRYRHMPVSWIDLDHRKPCIKVVGEQFELTLGSPCLDLTPEDFPDGNGETPVVLGTYLRALDTSPETKLHFSARLFHWFNQSVPYECYSDVSEI